MELKRRTENELIEELKGIIAAARTIMLVSYRGLTIEQDTRLRRLLREHGCKYQIYKHTLLERALIESGHTNLAYYGAKD
ncbi:MAG: 50S ribosomal protein L10 [Lachnospiraceae bacterium]|nr:50S ribosomal protein L10 [Lachnospiraceae bacterium]